MYDARAGGNIKKAPPLPPQMVTTKDVLNGSSSRRGLHEGSFRATGVVSRHMIDELNSQRNNSANSGNGATSQGSSFVNGGIVTVRNERRVVGSEVPGNIVMNGSKIMGT